MNHQNTVVMDRRVTRVFEWFTGIFASLLVIVLVWVGSTLMEVRESVAIMKVQSAPTPARMDRIDDKLQSMQQQVNSIENKVAVMEARQSKEGRQ